MKILVFIVLLLPAVLNLSKILKKFILLRITSTPNWEIFVLRQIKSTPNLKKILLRQI